MRRFLEGAYRINNDHGDTHVLGELDNRGHKHYVDGYGIANDGNGIGHVQ
jgi:hypothetical protein